MATEKNDWVDVKLTAFGEEQAAGAPLRVQEGNGGQGFVFVAGESQRVTRAFDWERVLKPWHHNGHALFEIIDSEAAAQLRAEGIDATQTPQGIEVKVPEVGA